VHKFKHLKDKKQQNSNFYPKIATNWAKTASNILGNLIMNDWTY